MPDSEPVMILEPPVIGSASKAIKLITEMKKRDLLLVGFIAMLGLSFGVLTGYIESPLLTMAEQHTQILQDGRDDVIVKDELIKIAKLQLYLARESCLHGAETETEKSRCDRDPIREAISGIEGSISIARTQ